MKSPLQHLEDCSGVHYRLQLNCYRFILEKYYDLRVSMMMVVCCHPDNDLIPFVDRVPVMQKETHDMMEWQLARAKQSQ